MQSKVLLQPISRLKSLSVHLDQSLKSRGILARQNRSLGKKPMLDRIKPRTAPHRSLSRLDVNHILPVHKITAIM